MGGWCTAGDCYCWMPSPKGQGSSGTLAQFALLYYQTGAAGAESVNGHGRFLFSVIRDDVSASKLEHGIDV
jgi:hypothetical protein